MISRLSYAFATALVVAFLTTTVFAQQVPGSEYHITPAKVQPTITPGQLTLLGLEERFQQDVAKGGGKAFASWFADDAVALSNGEKAVLGQTGIAATAAWDPAVYQLTWTPEGAQMGPSNDMGFTWGHYQSTYSPPGGKQVVKTGRYITIWKKLKGGAWKVAMDASANEPPSLTDLLANPPKP